MPRPNRKQNAANTVKLEREIEKEGESRIEALKISESIELKM